MMNRIFHVDSGDAKMVIRGNGTLVNDLSASGLTFTYKKSIML